MMHMTFVIKTAKTNQNVCCPMTKVVCIPHVLSRLRHFLLERDLRQTCAFFNLLPRSFHSPPTALVAITLSDQGQPLSVIPHLTSLLGQDKMSFDILLLNIPLTEVRFVAKSVMCPALVPLKLLVRMSPPRSPLSAHSC